MKLLNPIHTNLIILNFKCLQFNRLKPDYKPDFIAKFDYFEQKSTTFI